MVRGIKEVFKKARGVKFNGDAIMRGVKKAGNFIKDQLKHPATQQLALDSAGILAMNGGNVETAAPMLGARLAQEAGAATERTIRHYGGGSKFGQLAGRLATSSANRSFEQMRR